VDWVHIVILLEVSIDKGPVECLGIEVGVNGRLALTNGSSCLVDTFVYTYIDVVKDISIIVPCNGIILLSKTRQLVYFVRLDLSEVVIVEVIRPTSSKWDRNFRFNSCSIIFVVIVHMVH
jgi:membrane-anchored protein YejM (alkaline phosphatase superfamily)